MIMAFTVDARSAMLFVITIPILSVVVFGIMLATMPLYKGVQANLDRIMTSTRENLTGVRVIGPSGRSRTRQGGSGKTTGRSPLLRNLSDVYQA